MLTEEQRSKYDMARQLAREDLEQLDREIVSELTRVRQRLQELQQAKRAVKQIYDGACARMGIESVIEVKEISFAELEKQAT